MPRKGYKPEEIVAKLRQIDVLASQGQSMRCDPSLRSSKELRSDVRVAFRLVSHKGNPTVTYHLNAG
jgi:hypothetical protein